MKKIWRIFLLAVTVTMFSAATPVDAASVSRQTRREMKQLTIEVARAYEVPAWFLLAIVHRESSFNPNGVSLDDGIEGEANWNHYDADCAVTADGYPHGVGLTKLTGWMYQGMPYPYCLSEPDDSNKNYYYSMAKQRYGDWIDMEDVSRLDDPFDPRQNLERFLTGYAIPAQALFSEMYPEEDVVAIWRRVAFHWNKGMYKTYDPNDQSYLKRYDEYVARYAP